MRWDRQNLFVIAAITNRFLRSQRTIYPTIYNEYFVLWGFRYSGDCFHTFYSNSAGLSYVARYNEVYVIAGFVIAGCHCIRTM